MTTDGKPAEEEGGPNLEDEAELTARGMSFDPKLRRVVESPEWRRTVNTAADKLANEASDENRIFPKNSHTLPDEIVSHYISEDDLTRIAVAAKQSRSTAAEQLLLGGMMGLATGAIAGVCKVYKLGGIGGLDTADVINIVLAACVLFGIGLLRVVGQKSPQNTVDGICDQIRKRHKYTRD